MQSFKLNTNVLPVIDANQYYTVIQFPEEAEYTDEGGKLWDAYVIEKALPYIEQAVHNTDESIQVSDLSYFHPRAYNFQGDEINFTLTLDDQLLTDLINQYKANTGFIEFLRKYQSYDGFWSFMASNKQEFDEQSAEDPEKSLCQIIMFKWLSHKADAQESFEYDVYEDAREVDLDWNDGDVDDDYDDDFTGNHQMSIDDIDNDTNESLTESSYKNYKGYTEEELKALEKEVWDKIKGLKWHTSSLDVDPYMTDNGVVVRAFGTYDEIAEFETELRDALKDYSVDESSEVPLSDNEAEFFWIVCHKDKVTNESLKEATASEKLKDLEDKLNNLKDGEQIKLSGNGDAFGYTTLVIEKNSKAPNRFHIWLENKEGEIANEMKYSSLDNVLSWAKKYDEMQDDEILDESIESKSIYSKLKAVCSDDEIDHHESDLYVKVKPETTAIINEYKFKDNVEKFIDQITKTPWYDIPFAYTPSSTKEEALTEAAANNKTTLNTLLNKVIEEAEKLYGTWEQQSAFNSRAEFVKAMKKQFTDLKYIDEYIKAWEGEKEGETFVSLLNQIKDILDKEMPPKPVYLENKPLTEDEDMEDERAQALRAYLELDDDVVIENDWDSHYVVKDSQGYRYEGNSGDREYFVVDEDEAYELAKQDIESIFDDMGLEAFSPDFQEWIKNNAIKQDWFEEACRESYESYVEDIETEDSEEYENRLVEEAYSEGLIDDTNLEYHEEEEVYYLNDIDIDVLKEEYVDYLVERNGPDYVQWYIDNFGMDSLDVLIKNNSIQIDMDMVVDECISLDGVAHFIARYDGDELDLGNGLFAYRDN